MTNPDGSLKGVRVLDLSRILAGPWAAQMLGDFGADVIKVERPGKGDEARMYGPSFLPDRGGTPTRESGFYLAANRNKRSITIDLSQSQGRDLVRDLARESDVLLENFKVGTLERMSLGYAQLKELNPGLVYCSVTGYGQSGPYASRPGYDAVFQAQGGLMSLTGIRDNEPGAGPMKVGPSIVDVMAGYNAVIGILAALRHRDATGQGQYIDVALLDTVVAAMSHATSHYLTAGIIPLRLGDEGNGGGPSQIARCIDGTLYITCGNDGQFRRMCEVLDRPDLPDDPLYANVGLRSDNRGSLRAILDARFGSWHRAPLESALAVAGVPCGAVNDLAEVFADPQVRHRGVAVTMPHPLAGVMRVAANPVRMTHTPARYERHPPLLGEHTDQILADVLGLDTAAIAQLHEARIV